MANYKNNKGTQNRNNSKNYKAKSGAKTHIKFNGNNPKEFFMTAWKVIDGAMHSYKIFVPKDSDGTVHVSKQGKEWLPVVVVQSCPTKQNVIVGGLMNVANHKVYIKDWNWVINPNASNGGYCGKHISKNYD